MQALCARMGLSEEGTIGGDGPLFCPLQERPSYRVCSSLHPRAVLPRSSGEEAIRPTRRRGSLPPRFSLPGRFRMRDRSRPGMGSVFLRSPGGSLAARASTLPGSYDAPGASDTAFDHTSSDGLYCQDRLSGQHNQSSIIRTALPISVLRRPRSARCFSLRWALSVGLKDPLRVREQQCRTYSNRPDRRSQKGCRKVCRDVKNRRVQVDPGGVPAPRRSFRMLQRTAPG